MSKIAQSEETFAKRFGPEGEKLAKEMHEAAAQYDYEVSRTMADFADLIKGWSEAERVQLTKLSDGRILPGDATQRVRDALLAYHEIMDRSLGIFGAAGGTRQSKFAGGARMPAKGSGRPAPHFLSQEGLSELSQIFQHLEGAVKDAPPALNRAIVTMMARARAAGTKLTRNQALSQLRAYSREALTSPAKYLSKSRVPDLPDEWFVWDPAITHGKHFHDVMLDAVATRQWGDKLENLEDRYLKMKAHVGGTAETGKDVDRLSEFVERTFGKSRPIIMAGERIMWNAVSNYETVVRMGFRPLSVVRNLFQPFVTDLDTPLHYKLGAMIDYYKLAPTPKWRRDAAARVAYVRRSGAINERMALGEELPTRGLTAASMRAFRGVEVGSQYITGRAAQLRLANILPEIIKRAKRDAKAERIVKLLGLQNVLGETSPWRFVGHDISETRRWLSKSGIDLTVEELAAKSQTGGAGWTDKDIARVMWEANTRKHFAQRLVSNPVWWNSSPGWRAMLKYRPFSLRMTNLIWRDVVKEAAMHQNYAPAVKMGVAAIIGGEVYMYLSGLLRSRDRGEATWARRAMRDLQEGGAVGILSDFAYGDDWMDKATSYLLGPTGSTVKNIIETGQNIAAGGPATAILNARALASKEVGFVRDWFEDAYQIAQRDERRKWNKLVGVASDWEKQQKSYIQDFPVTPRTVPYRFAADMLQANDIDAAAHYIRIGAGQRQEAGLEEDLRAFSQAMRVRGPRGSMSARNWQKFLTSRSAESAREYRAADVQWANRIRRVIAATRPLIPPETYKGHTPRPRSLNLPGGMSKIPTMGGLQGGISR